MSYDSNTLPTAMLDRVAKALSKPEERGALADQLCRREEVRVPKGEYDVLGVKALMPRDRSSSRSNHGVQFGDSLPNRQDQFDGTEAYDCDRFGGEDDIKKSDISRIVEETDIDAVAHKLRMCKQDGEVALDGRLDGILTDNSLHQTYDATSAGNGTWDTDSATPLSDIRAAYKKVPGQELTAYVGTNVVDYLLEHPDFLAEVSNFSAGQLGEGQLANLMRTKFSRINDVVLGDSYFKDGSEEGQAYSTAYQSPDVFGLFIPGSIDLIEDVRTGPDTGQDDGGSSGVVNVYYARVADIRKPHEETSVKMINHTP
jgi:hypothetical protein